MLEPTNREIGTMLQAAPAFANHGVFFCCSIFARVIVGLLAEAETPELEHLRMFADDEPRARSKRWEAKNRQQSEPNEENRYRHKHNDHPCRKLKAQLGSWPV